MRSNQRRKSPARSLAVRAAQGGSAAAAAAIARRVSPVPMLGPAPSVAAVAGLCTGSVPPPSAPTQLPSMKHCSLNNRGSWSFMGVLVSTDVLMKKLDAAVEREPRTLRIEARPIRAIEAVLGGVKMIDPARIGGPYFVHRGSRNMRIPLAEVKHHGDARGLR